MQTRSISDFVAGLDAASDSTWAFRNFDRVLREAVELFGPSHILEVGGGRSPSFSVDEIRDYSVKYTVNDVSQAELDRAPEGYSDTLCADVSKELPEIQCDLIFSRMVFEHVEDNFSNLRNQLAILSPGGVAIHLHPVLYSLPFVLNRIIPERLTSSILSRADPIRNDDEIPKFPAHYDWCKATEKHRNRILGIGFSEVLLVPFWGHSYYRKIPLLDKLNGAFTSEIARRDIRAMASFCYTILQK